MAQAKKPAAKKPAAKAAKKPAAKPAAKKPAAKPAKAAPAKAAAPKKKKAAPSAPLIDLIFSSNLKPVPAHPTYKADGIQATAGNIIGTYAGGIIVQRISKDNAFRAPEKFPNDRVLAYATMPSDDAAEMGCSHYLLLLREEEGDEAGEVGRLSSIQSVAVNEQGQTIATDTYGYVYTVVGDFTVELTPEEGDEAAEDEEAPAAKPGKKAAKEEAPAKKAKDEDAPAPKKKSKESDDAGWGE